MEQTKSVPEKLTSVEFLGGEAPAPLIIPQDLQDRLRDDLIATKELILNRRDEIRTIATSWGADPGDMSHLWQSEEAAINLLLAQLKSTE